MKKTILLLIILLGIISSCEVTDFDLQDNPNKLTPESVTPDYLFNEIQVLFKEIMEDVSLNTDDIMRYEAMLSTYTDIADVDVFNLEWDKAYKLRKNYLLLQNLAATNDNLRFHLGAAKVLHAYTFATMVDYLGDIPFSQSNNVDSFPNPESDSGAVIYQSLIDDLDSAIIDFENVGFSLLTDLYGNNNPQKWTKAANTLKLKMLLNRRLVDQSGSTDAINALLLDDNLIENASDNFMFSYSTEISPEGRSEYFARAYLSDGPSEYMGNYFMWLLKDSKTIQDPRLRYYIYRQTTDEPGPLGFLRCSPDNGATFYPEFDFCYIGDKYWGRDHGDDNTIPPDRFLRTAYGLYPAGGAFDADNFIAAKDSENMTGAGILPLLMSSNTNFMKAEAAITLNTTGDPVLYLETAIRNSMSNVLNFSTVDATYASTAADVDNYVTEVLNEYNGVTSTDEKLNIIIREYYLATFGNSVESYNAYRRTGYPTNIQTPVINEGIPFPRTFPYPVNEVNANSSLEQKAVTKKVFWDNNPDGFIN